LLYNFLDSNFTYKPKFVFCLDANKYSKPQFGIIKYVAIDNSKQFYIIYDSCENIGLDSHKYAYEISFELTRNIGIVPLNLNNLFVTRSISYTDLSKLITKFV